MLGVTLADLPTPVLIQHSHCSRLPELSLEEPSVSMDTETNNRPKVQIDDLVREMTDDEYADLIASGWTMEPENDVEQPA